MFFTFPEDARWNAERQAFEFGVEIGQYRGVVTVPRLCSSAYSRSGPPPRSASRPTTASGPGSRVSPSGRSPCQLTEDGKVEISGRDLR
jgi:hypothetical protein